MSSSEPCRLYLISPPTLEDSAHFARNLPGILEAGDVACLQLRLKTSNEEDILNAIGFLQPVCERAEVALILNDRPDLAAKSGCDGVHIGTGDMPYTDARAIVGEDAAVGVSCGASRHLAMIQADAGADYVAFGAFFPSPTKSDTSSASLEILEIWSQTTNVPCVAVGGITLENCNPIINSGADFLAVSSAVWDHPNGPKTAVRLFTEQMAG